jgi:8-oxo-dGTP pyrophosphatase MutT (NUDIX family)
VGATHAVWTCARARPVPGRRQLGRSRFCGLGSPADEERADEEQAVSDATAAVPATPAATVIVARDGDDGLEVLMLRRSDVGAFAGMWVFPGGRVDDDDAGHDEESRARSAATREAMEEVGVRVSAPELVPFSHWTPPVTTPKRFATWFFVAPWDGGAITVDGHEIVDHAWLTPMTAVARRLPLAPPTWVTLHHLAEYATFDALRASPPVVERYLTRPTKADGTPILMWHGDVGYDSGDPHPDGPRHRLWMPGDGAWRYERRLP